MTRKDWEAMFWLAFGVAFIVQSIVRYGLVGTAIQIVIGTLLLCAYRRVFPRDKHGA